jgi:hypothetical protein
MAIIWQCPLCDPEIGRFERITETGMMMAIAAHILRHEDSAGLRAVDMARLRCTDTACSLGKSKVLNHDSGLFEPRLTDYDIKFLNGMKIKVG